MSFIYRDGNSVPRAKTNQAISVYNRFDKYWGKKFINIAGEDIEVYENYNRPFYIGGTYIEDFYASKFIKGIGLSWDELKSNSLDREIETLHFKLKDTYLWDGYYSSDVVGSPSEPAMEYRFNTAVPTKEEFNNYISQFIKEDDVFSVTISYGGDSRQYFTEHELPYYIDETGIVAGELNTEQIRAIIMSNPWFYLANSNHKGIENNVVHYSKDNGDIASLSFIKAQIPACDIASSNQIGMLAVFGTDTFELVSELPTEIISTKSIKSNEVLEYKFTYTYRYKGVVTALYSEVLSWYAFYNPTPNLVKGTNISTIEDSRIKRLLVDIARYSDLYEDDTPHIDGLYIRSGRESNLIVDKVRRMKKREFVKLLSSQIDTGYSIEAQEWYEKVLFVVIVIVVIVAAYFTGGATAAAGGSFLAGAAGGAAVGFMLGGLVMNHVGGLSSAGYVKIIGAFSQIAGYLGMIAGLVGVIQGATKQVAIEATREAVVGLSKEAAEVVAEAIKEVTISQIAVQLVDDAISSVTSMFTSAANATVSQVVSNVDSLVGLITKSYQYMTEPENNRLRSEYASMAKEEEEYNKTILDKYFKEAGVISHVMNERLSTPDVLQDLAVDIENRIGQDDNFRAWYVDVNL